MAVNAIVTCAAVLFVTFVTGSQPPRRATVAGTRAARLL
jgi:hypothetical protein